jgi:hypothetical protein
VWIRSTRAYRSEVDAQLKRTRAALAQLETEIGERREHVPRVTEAGEHARKGEWFAGRGREGDSEARSSGHVLGRVCAVRLRSEE